MKNHIIKIKQQPEVKHTVVININAIKHTNPFIKLAFLNGAFYHLKACLITRNKY